MTRSLYNTKGQRKYTTKSEREKILQVAKRFDRDTECLALVITYTGCRVSEAVELCIRHIDFEEGAIIFESLKKRGKLHFRSVPVPNSVLDTLHHVYGLRQAKNRDVRIFNFTRRTAHRKIKAIMNALNIEGPQACPRGLRHGFGVYATAECKIALDTVQNALGHASITTTTIYTKALGKEKRQIFERMWEGDK